MYHQARCRSVSLISSKTIVGIMNDMGSIFLTTFIMKQVRFCVSRDVQCPRSGCGSGWRCWLFTAWHVACASSTAHKHCSSGWLPSWNWPTASASCARVYQHTAVASFCCQCSALSRLVYKGSKACFSERRRPNTANPEDLVRRRHVVGKEDHTSINMRVQVSNS
jgi:hypothetical protein